jgi:hypothetical protein
MILKIKIFYVELLILIFYFIFALKNVLFAKTYFKIYKNKY